MVKEPVDCHDCGCLEGQLHELGCDMERCPFCGEQLLGCDCMYGLLGLVDAQKHSEETCYLPRKVFENGLSDEQLDIWLDILHARGRIPFIQYPNICGKCGKLYPDLFKVSDEEWEKYIQIDQRDLVLCQECYDYIKSIIDNPPTGKAKEEFYIREATQEWTNI